jgi:hypothetical protein
MPCSGSKVYPHEKADNGIYSDLKKAILDSNSKKEYKSKIVEIMGLK